MLIRLDKVLSESNVLSRSESKAAAKRGRISVNGVAVKSAEIKVSDSDVISLDGVPVIRRRFFYIMLNKPAGYVCSTDDPTSRIVTELLSPADRPDGIFPAGRLDRDTVGFVFLTNDGALAHDLLSPKKHVAKTYYFRCVSPLSPCDAKKLEEGVMLDDGLTLPASLSYDTVAAPCEGTITLSEGRFHQIKRMFSAVGNGITYLKRVAFGGIPLDPSLAEGEYRHLSESELLTLRTPAILHD